MEQVVITGGSGLLGRALVAHYAHTYRLTVISRSEKLQLPLRAAYPSVRFVLGDIRDQALLARIIPGHDTVIHAAALKHVPLSESEPTEYTSVNVGGSMAVLDAARQAGARVLGVSTDKSCAPRNVYGMTKLLMERVFTEQGQTTIRYGNVFASDGSVVVKWRQQLAESGEITVTDPDMTRFFFRIADAVDEIDWALRCAPAGVVVVPMLRAVRLGDLAEAVIRHAGGGRVVVTGPRPGEKTHEALLSEEDGARATICDGRVLLHPDLVASPIGPITSDAAHRIPLEELIAWLG